MLKCSNENTSLILQGMALKFIIMWHGHTVVCRFENATKSNTTLKIIKYTWAALFLIKAFSSVGASLRTESQAMRALFITSVVSWLPIPEAMMLRTKCSMTWKQKNLTWSLQAGFPEPVVRISAHNVHPPSAAFRRSNSSRARDWSAGSAEPNTCSTVACVRAVIFGANGRRKR